MEITAENMVQSSDSELLDIYRKSRRLYAEKKFERDSAYSRLEWQEARLFVSSAGRVADRQAAVKSSEVLAKKGQQIREMTRDLDLLKADLEALRMALTMRGAAAAKAETMPDLCAA
jgi:hypothetical protein